MNEENQTPNFNDTYDVIKQAEKYNMEINLARVNEILYKLSANETKFGAPYCPCLNSHTEDAICPCKYMRKQQACRCGLYVSEKGVK